MEYDIDRHYMYNFGNWSMTLDNDKGYSICMCEQKSCRGREVFWKNEKNGSVERNEQEHQFV